MAWAAHGQQRHVVDALLPSAGIFDAVQCGGVERATALLDEDPTLANATDDRGNSLVCYLHPDVPHLEPMLDVLIAHGAVLDVRASHGTLLDRAIAHGWTDFAALLRARGARTMAEMERGS